MGLMWSDAWIDAGAYAVRYLALATDYDGTLARDGAVSSEAVAALDDLAELARQLEQTDHLAPAEGRARLREAIERSYTLPA